MASQSRKQLEEFLRTIEVPQGTKVLDIGGSQLPIKGRIQDKGGDFTILDLEQPHEYKQKVDVECDINNEIFEAEIVQEYNAFDVAFCIEVSEYLWNPVVAFENIAKFLKPGGVLYASFHFVYPVHNPAEQDYLRYTSAGAVKILEQTGFETVDIQPRVFITCAIPQGYLTEVMRPAKIFDRHHWQGCLIKAVKN